MKKTTILLLALVAACSDGSPVESTPTHIEQAGPRDCTPVGNVPGRQVCAVTYVQLMVHPERYDGRRIKVLAWTQPSEGSRVVLFPSVESLHSAELIATIDIEDGQKGPDIQRFLASGNVDRHPVPIYVSGTFRFAREATRHSDGFGSLTQIEDFSGGP